MVAIPIDTLGDNPSISNYFGKSKWFAIIEDDVISFEKNKNKNGCDIADWLYDLGVTHTIINHIGLNPLLKLNELDIKCLSQEQDLNSLVEVLDKMESKTLNKVTDSNQNIVVDLEKGCDEVC